MKLKIDISELTSYVVFMIKSNGYHNIIFDLIEIIDIIMLVIFLPFST